jgi:transposase
VRGKPASPVLRGGRRSNAPPLPDRTIRPVKVQQRSSGGCWRTLTGLAEFALVQSYLSTAAKWGLSKLDALRDLFNGNAWLPPGIEPTG